MKLEQNPSVSIVLPTYNGTKYIWESLDSILDQTYQDWELIIVDDCSTDETPTIIEEYAEKDKRIRVIHNTANRRLPHSLNIGFASSRGKYLTWTSDDNYYLPTAIEAMVNALSKDDACPMVCADMEYIDEDGSVTGQAPPYDDRLIWLRNLVGACFMYRRGVLELVGEYNPDKIYVEDYDYWLRIRKRMGEIKRIPKTLYRYRYHDNSLTAIKMQQVCSQRARLRLEYQDDLKVKYQNDRRILCEIYYELLLVSNEDGWFLQWLYNSLPEIHHECMVFSLEQKFMILGAGEFGDKAWELLGNQVVGYIDNDKNKVGKKKHGLLIYSFEEFMKGGYEADLLVAIGMEHLYEVICQIVDAGIDKYWIYQNMARIKSGTTII